ncbi:MAG: 50S ribosomal protein L11 methyltransferase [Parachlamydiaceae bacterium]
MEAIRIRIKAGYPSTLAWETLEAEGETILYSTETEDGVCELFIKKNLFIKDHEFIEALEATVLEDIDWEKQWELHSPQFYDGMMHVNLSQHGVEKQLLLKPGPGFGDLSHPTTRLILSMLPDQLEERVVLDIGTGSGILALAAAALGAYQTVGIEIDPLAIRHAEENAQLNQLEKKVQFFQPSQIEMLTVAKPYLVLMNMIIKEQQMAWKMLQLSQQSYGEAITSGVLMEEKDAYLEITRAWGWTLREESSQDGWLGLRFSFGTRVG